MNEQIIILLFLIFFTVATIGLYMLKSNRNANYKNDERWIFIMNKACKAANYINYIALVIIAILQTLSLFNNSEVSIPLNRVLIYALFFFGIRNLIELIALKYYDTQI